MFVAEHQPDSMIADFAGKRVRRRAHEGSSFSEVEPSGKPSAAHAA